MPSKKYLRDVAERALSTFLGTFIAALASSDLTDVSQWQAAAIGGLSAALTLLKGAAARWVGDKETASLSRKI